MVTSAHSVIFYMLSIIYLHSIHTNTHIIPILCRYRLYNLLHQLNPPTKYHHLHILPPDLSTAIWNLMKIMYRCSSFRAGSFPTGSSRIKVRSSFIAGRCCWILLFFIRMTVGVGRLGLSLFLGRFRPSVGLLREGRGSLVTSRGLCWFRSARGEI